MFQQREASVVFERVNRTGARIVCTRLSVSADHVRKRRRTVRKRVSQRLFSMRFPYYLQIGGKGGLLLASRTNMI